VNTPRPYQFFWEVGGLERGPLSLATTTEELRKHGLSYHQAFWIVILHMLPGHRARKFNIVVLDEIEETYFIKYWWYKKKYKRVSEAVVTNYIFG
jgi:hypothetical protein